MTSTTFAELIERRSLLVNDGYRTKKAELTESGIPILRVAEIGDGFIAPKSQDRISEDFRRAIGAKLSEPGDILLTTKGTVGRRAIVPRAAAGFAYSPQVCFFRVLDESIDRRWLYYWLGGSEFWDQAFGVSTQTDMAPYISLRDLRAISVTIPSLAEQRAIAATLGALDDKIESNHRQRALLRSLGYARYVAACGLGNTRSPLEKLTTSIARGVAPKYADNDPAAPRVINQRCIRDGWVSLGPSRRMVDREVAPAKRAFHGDILVNSTGTGTLGRVARWHGPPIFVDGHVTIVRPDPAYAPPTITAYALLGREMDIVDLATGSTGQTELSPKRLAELDVVLPKRAEAEQLESDLLALEVRSEQLAAESARLANLRDTLLPGMLSGLLHSPIEAA